MASKTRTHDILGWAVVAFTAAGLIGYGYWSSEDHKAHAIRPDGCLAYQPVPAVLTIVNDETDKLEGDQPRRWRATVMSRVLSMPTGTQIQFAMIREHVPAELKLLKGPCVPPTGKAPQLRTIRTNLDRTIDGVEQELEAAHELDQSAIRGTILAVAADPSSGVTKNRTILVESDFLENEGASSVYHHRGLSLPPPVGRPLEGVTVYFVVLQNQRDGKYQTHALIETWVAWARAAGANAIVDAPWLGYFPQSNEPHGELG